MRLCTMYRHTTFYCALLYCASDTAGFVCLFFLTLPIEGKILHQQKIMITLLRYLTHCSGLEPNPVYL